MNTHTTDCNRNEEERESEEEGEVMFGSYVSLFSWLHSQGTIIQSEEKEEESGNSLL